MNIVRRHLRLANVLALVAMLALVLLPSVSQALAGSGNGSGSGYAEVCTPQGTRLVALAGGEQQPAGAALHLQHCPFCLAGFATLGPPPAPLVLPLPPLAAALAPPRFLQAPRTPFAWAAAQPRGPPVPV